jgi:methionyl-tRNA formyltransferase
MKIVIISQYTPREKIVVHEIVKNFDQVTLVQSGQRQGLVVKPQNQSRARKKTRSQSFFDRNALRFFHKFHKISIHKKTKHLKIDSRDFEKVSIPFAQINTERGLEFLKSLQPDILFTCNAPILKGEILNIPKIASINVHYGMPPHYRGNDTLFWAYIKKDFDNLGGCLHYTTKGVDRGNILAEVFPSLDPKDSLVHVDIKTSELLALAAVKILKDIENCDEIPTGKVQVEKGRNYKLYERTLLHHLKYLAQWNLGILKPNPRKEKTVFYIK